MQDGICDYKKAVIIFLIGVLFYFSVISAGELHVTQEHPFLINKEWVPASSLEVGDELNTLDGKIVKIININDINLESPIDVYNLEAGVFHDFIISENIIVHNSDVVEEIGSDVIKAIESITGRARPTHEELEILYSGNKNPNEWAALDSEGNVVELPKQELSPEIKKLLENSLFLPQEIMNPKLSDARRLYYAEILAGRNNLASQTTAEQIAILEMHYAESGEGFGRILTKVRKGEGRISSEETRVLMQEGVTGTITSWEPSEVGISHSKLTRAKNQEILDKVGEYNTENNLLKVREAVAEYKSQRKLETGKYVTESDIASEIKGRFSLEDYENYFLDKTLSEYRTQVNGEKGRYPTREEALSFLEIRTNIERAKLENLYDRYIENEEIINKFFEDKGNTEIIRKIARDFLRNEPDDIALNAGRVGALRALRNYNGESKGFYSFLKLKVISEIREVVTSETFGVTGLPAIYPKIFEKIREYKEWDDLWYEFTGRISTQSEIAEQLKKDFPGITDQRITNALCKFKRGIGEKVSLDEPAPGQEKTMPHVNTRQIYPEFEVIRNENTELVNKLLESDTLSPLQKGIIIGWMKGKSTKLIAQELKTSESNIRKNLAGTKVNGKIELLGVIDRLRWRLKFWDLKYPKGHKLRGEDISLLDLTKTQRDIITSYHGKGKTRMSFDQIAKARRARGERFGIDESAVRATYFEGVNRLLNKGDLDLSINYYIAQWSSLRSDPSLCAPLPQ